MSPSVSSDPESGELLRERTEKLFGQRMDAMHRRVDRLFTWLMPVQAVVAVLLALFVTPQAWRGQAYLPGSELRLALLGGVVLCVLPVALTRGRPGSALTRHVVALCQVLWSALLILLAGGRLEMHFHAAVSLVLLAAYGDPKVLGSATAALVLEFAARILLWPEPVSSPADPQGWRIVEVGFWMLCLDAVLLYASRDVQRNRRELASRQAEMELAKEREEVKARELDHALRELGGFQEHLIRVEKLAAVGQLAASVGHELRNPLAAVRNAHAYLSRRLARVPAEVLDDPRVPQFLNVMERELNACAKIISDLLDFARERPPALQPCPLRPLVDEAIGVVPPREGVRVTNGVPESLPVPHLDKEQFRQVLVNLVQNAAEAIPPGRGGEVSVVAEAGEGGPWSIRVVDDGAGITPDVLPKIFEPLFTTKTRGTGLGLAIVAGMVQRHGGTITVRSEAGQGSEFLIQLPAPAAAKAA